MFPSVSPLLNCFVIEEEAVRLERLLFYLLIKISQHGKYHGDDVDYQR